MRQPTNARPKMKFRRRQLKRALVITMYAFVAIATIIGIVSPALL